VQSVIAVVLKRPKKVEVELKNGTKLSGKLIRAETSGLVVQAKGGMRGTLQVLPYDQLSTVRVDLGPNRDWQKLGIAIGTVVAIIGGTALGSTDSTAGEVAAIPVVIGAPIVAAKLLGDHHRDWLIIEVR
jgi:hypothetical protein